MHPQLLHCIRLSVLPVAGLLWDLVLADSSCDSTRLASASKTVGVSADNCRQLYCRGSCVQHRSYELLNGRISKVASTVLTALALAPAPTPLLALQTHSANSRSPVPYHFLPSVEPRSVSVTFAVPAKGSVASNTADKHP